MNQELTIRAISFVSSSVQVRGKEDSGNTEDPELNSYAANGMLSKWERYIRVHLRNPRDLHLENSVVF